MTIEDLENLLKNIESRNIEYKKALGSFSDNDLFDYCAALANEGGGQLVLGITNQRAIFGTSVYINSLPRKEGELFRVLNINIRTEEINHPSGRVVIFHIPSRPRGQIIRSRGKYIYPMRSGESLTEMDQETIKQIFAEVSPDWSTQVLSSITIPDLDHQAIDNLRRKWAIKTGNSKIELFNDEKVIRSLELMNDYGVTNAAVLLVGKKSLIDKILPCAEIIFEWRQDPKKIAYDYREEWRKPFLLIYEQLWQVLNQRNLRIPFQEGFIQREIYAFTEKPIREAILNAITHRDYTITTQSIFIKASPESFIIQSPGGLVSPVTIDTIITKSAWRNRRIAEVFQQIGLVERSGQGIDEIYEQTIKEGKGFTSFAGTDKYSVQLTIPAVVKDPEFILYLEKIINQRQINLSFEEIYELEQIHEKGVLQNPIFRSKFLEHNLIEKSGSGKGTRYLLSKQFYEYSNQRGEYTKIKGISRDQKKQLILNHLTDFSKVTTSDLQKALEMSQRDVNNLLQELKKKGNIRHNGSRRGGHWELIS